MPECLKMSHYADSDIEIKGSARKQNPKDRRRAALEV